MLLCVIYLLSAIVLIRSSHVNDTRIYAIYFPQFHEDKMNSKLWGKGFTDWDRVKVHAGKVNRYGNRIPQPTDLGYYDIARKEVRAKQAVLAKQYGVDGFLYYHYWFGAPGLGPVLSTPLERMLEDGEPDLPFAFIWTNEDWSASWHGASKADGGLLLAMNYTSRYDPNTIAHYGFLRRFFHHKNYIKINGAPLFMPYRLNKYNYENRILKQAVAYIEALRAMAIADGFPGLHTPLPALFVDHELYTDRQYKPRLSHANVSDGIAFYSYPSLLPNRHVEIPSHCNSYSGLTVDRHHYLGVTTTFDHSIRRTWDKAAIWQRAFSRYNVTDAYLLDMVRAMTFERCCQLDSVRSRGGRFVMLNAWNEWGEGMVLEPSDVYGYDFLRATLEAKAVTSMIQCDSEALKTWENEFRTSRIHSPLSKSLKLVMDELHRLLHTKRRITDEVMSRFADVTSYFKHSLLPSSDSRITELLITHNELAQLSVKVVKGHPITPDVIRRLVDLQNFVAKDLMPLLS